ncbi:uncharacterized protein Dwil_GK24675 [Drosophila willistoni]|uniref:DUF4794 domain-containing protein n=1 Tax=Drosophila willistoni TaxID=7260 RepID=B4MZK5_DROWI|nr:biofilm and cell wall regulator 1 [Drosophila willistoni]EDW77790.1 uncharacterized protein Dwil_GK24675 [Drosophila willistoni]
MNFNHKLLVLLFIATWVAVVVPPCVARGGRGRGGGSFGGLFGGWRKYKKPSSSGGGRRVISGEPMQTSMSIPKPPPPPAPPKPMIKPKPQVPNYPRQQMPTGFTGYGGQGGMGGTYYSNPQALPAGAIFYAQPPPMPMSRGSGTGDFLTGMLAGHMMNNLLYGRRHHVYHRNREGEPPAQTQSNNGRDIIIIENGAVQNESSIPEEAVAVAPANPLSEENSSSMSSESDTEDEVTPEPPRENSDAAPGPGGIICFPIMLNETNPENPEETREVERIVCFPAPDPNLIEADISTTSTEPPIVAGDIGGPDTEEDVTDVDAETDINAAPIASYVAGRAAHANVNA